MGIKTAYPGRLRFCRGKIALGPVQGVLQRSVFGSCKDKLLHILLGFADVVLHAQVCVANVNQRFHVGEIGPIAQNELRERLPQLFNPLDQLPLAQWDHRITWFAEVFRSHGDFHGQWYFWPAKVGHKSVASHSNS